MAKATRATELRTVLAPLLSLVVGICLSACGEKEDVRSPGTPGRAAATEGARPPSPTASRFLAELAKAEYPEAKAPETAFLPRWDFSGEREYRYGYEQTVESRMGFGLATGGPTGFDQRASVKGKLLLKSKGDGTANVVLQDMTMTATFSAAGEKKDEPKTMTVPPMVIQGMREDGTLKVGASEQETLMKLLLPLPTRALKVGESVDVPAEIPFNAMGSLLMVQGRSRITLTKYVTIGGRTCARLDTDIEISKLDVPPELEGEYSFVTKGASVFYFDVEGRGFVSGTLALLMVGGVDAPTPKMALPGGEKPDLPARMRTDIRMDTLIRVTPLGE